MVFNSLREQDGSLDSALHALAHPVRRALLFSLSRVPKTSRELCAEFAQEGPSLHYQLRVLRQAGLVISRRDPPRSIRYCIEPTTLNLLTTTLVDVANADKTQSFAGEP